MKKRYLKSFCTLVFLIFFVFISATAQPPPPNHGQDEDQQPAPIGSGLIILLAMGAAYGTKKVYDARKEIKD